MRASVQRAGSWPGGKLVLMAHLGDTRTGSDAGFDPGDWPLRAHLASGDLVASALRLIASSLSARWCTLFLFLEGRDTLSPAGIWDSASDSLSVPRRTVAPDRIRRVVETGEPEVGYGTLEEWLGSGEVLPGEQFSGACIPVGDDDRRAGALSIIRSGPTTFEAGELDLALLAGRHVDICLRDAEFHRRVLEMANTDGLTGLYNYRYFIHSLEAEIERAARYGHPLSLLMLDIDDLKGYNDRFGHPQGNAAVRQLAGTVREVVRRIDLVARYGGDEFVVMLPETNSHQALQAAARIIEAVSAQPALSIPDGDPTRQLSVSVGLSSYPAPAGNGDALVRQADQAMYRAKEDPSSPVQVWRAAGPDGRGLAPSEHLHDYFNSPGG